MKDMSNRYPINMARPAQLITMVGIVFWALSVDAQVTKLLQVETNRVAELALLSAKTYKNPFVEIELDAVVTQPGGKVLRVPMFWAGGSRWCLRYASSVIGLHTFRTECSDTGNAKLHGVEGKFEVTAYNGEHPLYRHGPSTGSSDIGGI
jgi:hypothetical protein